MCLVTWTERFLFWLKLDLVASIMCNLENLDQWSPWPWTAPALPLAVPVYSGPALSGVTFQYQSPQLWFPPGLGCILSQCGLSVWQSCLLMIFLPSLAALPVPCPCPHATASPRSPTLSLPWYRAIPLFGGLCTSVFSRLLRCQSVSSLPSDILPSR